jgi:hypothetical protein
MLAMVAVDGVVTMVGLSVATGAETSTGWGRRLAAPLGVVLLYGAAALGLTGFAAPRAPDPPVRGAW